MNIHRIDYAQVPQLSNRDQAYQSEDNPFLDFLSYPPEIQSFRKAIADRKLFPVDRETLVSVLKEQYQQISNNEKTLANVNLLSQENTFTIITAHQPVLFTGPLYYIYKIFSAINMAEKLKATYPDYDFVPVFVSGAEDHDFDEINTAYIFNNAITWNQDKGGSVGRLNLDGIEACISELTSILNDKESGNTIKEWVNDAYNNSSNYGEFQKRLVHHIFGSYGLVILNPDNAQLKKAFIPIMKEELLNQKSKSLVEQTQHEIEALGYKSQAFAREINLFYLTDGSRERIIFENGKYEINNTELSFSESEIIIILDNHPERFSPNVIMRPLFQETILPNLAYIGGGGELAYWLERKSQFKAFQVFYPILIRRASLKILTKGQVKTLDKLGFSVKDIFKHEDELINEYISSHSEVELSLEGEISKIKDIYLEIATKAKKLDPTLEKKILAESTNQVKVIEQLESRLKRTVKSQQESEVNKIRNLKSKLFPNNGLQERKDNFLQYYDMVGIELLNILKEHIDAFDKSFMVIEI